MSDAQLARLVFASISAVGGRRPESPDDDLTALGIDPMARFLLLAKLEVAVDAEVPAGAIAALTTVDDVIYFVGKALENSGHCLPSDP